MTRTANLAQLPRLDRLTATDARFIDGEHLALTVPRAAWEAMGRPVDLQVVMTPLGQAAASAGRMLLEHGEPAEGAPADYRTPIRQEEPAIQPGALRRAAGLPDEDLAEYEAQDPEAREGLEAGL